MDTPPAKAAGPPAMARDRKGRPYTPAVSPRLRVLLVFVFAAVAVLGATGIYLLAITEALLAKAKEGSVGAAKLLLAYAIGKPASSPDPDHLDGQELKHFKDQVEVVNDVHELAREVGRAVDRRVRPGGVSDDFSAQLREMVQHAEKYDNPACLRAVANALNESDSGAGAGPAWAPPSANGLFGGLPPRIRELSQALFVVNEPSADEDLWPEEET